VESLPLAAAGSCGPEVHRCVGRAGRRTGSGCGSSCTVETLAVFPCNRISGLLRRLSLNLPYPATRRATAAAGRLPARRRYSSVSAAVARTYFVLRRGTAAGIMTSPSNVYAIVVMTTGLLVTLIGASRNVSAPGTQYLISYSDMHICIFLQRPVSSELQRCILVDG